MDHTAMIRRISAGAVALSVLAGGGVLAGCGSSASSSETAASTAAADTATQVPNGIERLPAKEILATSLAASKAASSVTVKGAIAEEGEEGISLNLVLGTDASTGTMSINGFSMETRVTGGTLYYKIDPAGAESILGPGEASAAIGGRWIKVSPGDGDDLLSDLGEFSDKDALLTSFLAPEGAATVKGTGDVKGTPVVFVTVTDDGGNGTLAIQTVGEPYPVQITNEGAKGAITFSNWNAPVNVTAPTGAVSPDEITGAGGSSN